MLVLGIKVVGLLDSIGKGFGPGRPSKSRRFGIRGINFFFTRGESH